VLGVSRRAGSASPSLTSSLDLSGEDIGDGNDDRKELRVLPHDWIAEAEVPAALDHRAYPGPETFDRDNSLIGLEVLGRVLASFSRLRHPSPILADVSL
jgi:hypothetical protein